MRAYNIVLLVPLFVFFAACSGTNNTPVGGLELAAGSTQYPQCNGNVGVCTCSQVVGSCTQTGLQFPVDASCNAQFCSSQYGICGLACSAGQYCSNGACVACDGGNGTVSYLQGTGGYYYNVCTPASTPVVNTLCGASSNWVQVDPGVKLTHLSVGGDGTTVWATDGTNTYIRTNVNGSSLNGDTWSAISPSDRFTVVAAGKHDFIWGTHGLFDTNVYYRRGITTTDENGTGWAPVAGACSWISAASDYSLWCISSNGLPYVRMGTSQTNPQGTSWQSTGGTLTKISVGNISTVWGVVTPANQIYSRTGNGPGTPAGTGWTLVDSNFKDVSAGSDGTVWAVNANGNVFQRVNNAWVGNNNVTLKSVAVGDKNNVWGIDSTGSAVRCQN